jgi:hypothetical protein
MIVSLSSVAGGPGVSSLSMLLAAGWPAEYTAQGSTSESPVRMGRVVLECDLDGGVYGARYGIGVEPGAATLVSRTRHSPHGADEIDFFGRPVGDQAWVVPGPESAEAARQLWSGIGVAKSVATAVVQDDRVWFVDAGRAGSSTPIAPLLSHASLSLLVCRADHESFDRMLSRRRHRRQASLSERRTERVLRHVAAVDPSSRRQHRRALPIRVVIQKSSSLLDLACGARDFARRS